jgi:serine phosphatase RsbU (regulator of sigma subunit)
MTNSDLAFGTTGVMQALKDCHDLKLDDALNRLFQTTAEYTGGSGRHDDTSVVLLERFESA